MSKKVETPLGKAAMEIHKSANEIFREEIKKLIREKDCIQGYLVGNVNKKASQQYIEIKRLREIDIQIKEMDQFFLQLNQLLLDAIKRSEAC